MGTGPQPRSALHHHFLIDWPRIILNIIKVQHAPKIRADYKSKWASNNIMEVQIGLATYFVDKLALRAGNEKDTEEAADTVGCCSLRVEHVKLEEPDQVHFDFLGTNIFLEK